MLDVVLVLESASDPVKEYRPLLVLFRRAEGGYTLSAKADNAVPASETGGVHSNDGFGGFEISKNTFVILQFGGSSEQRSARSQFRYQNGGWYLIGKTTEWTGPAATDGRLGGEMAGVTIKPPEVFVQYNLDTNYLTGGQVESWQIWNSKTGADRTVVKRRKITVKPLIRLEGFDDPY